MWGFFWYKGILFGEIMKKWILTGNTADYEGFAKELNIDKVAVKCMMNRGIDSIDKMKEFLSVDISGSFDYRGLPEIDKAVGCIKEAKENELKCRVIGDYDADGVCSTTILAKGLRLYGLCTDYAIPNRLTDGYGINDSIVTKAFEDGIGIIVTCDNGISAKEAIDKAKEYGIKVVVTDHHSVTDEVYPDSADACVNPRMKDNKYAFPDICGAQVAFKLLCALFENDVRFESVKYELLEFAAIATVTDVMPLLGENRSLVKWVLTRLKSPSNEGLAMLSKETNVSSKESNITCSDIGFQIGPCINATGRIDVADRAVDLFLCNDEKKIEEITKELISLNEERKELTEKCTRLGDEYIEKMISEEGGLENIIVLYLPECHVSICGLVAGRIKEKYYRPTLVFTDSELGVTGSGRSIDEYDIIEGVRKCSDILIKFGGHKAACGASLLKDNLSELRRRLNEEAIFSEDDLIQKLRIDADMPFGYVNEKVVDDLTKLEPFGTGNPAPVFALRNLRILSARKIGEDKNHLFINIIDSSNEMRTLKLWRRADEFDEAVRESFGEDALLSLYDRNVRNDCEMKMTVSYYPGINVFKGFRNVEFTVKDFKF